MTEELKPCPFCGGRVELRRDMQGFIIIECDSCKTSTYIFRKKTADIVEAWNTRAVVEPPHGDWHTGTPTDGGLYFVYEKYVGYAKRDLPTNISKKDLEDAFYNVIAWQKIEPPREYDT